MSTKNDVRFVIEETKGCSENKLFTSLFKSRYYRPKGKSVLFYDNDYKIVGVWNYEAEHAEN